MPHSLFVNTLAIDGTVVLVGVLALFVGVGLGVFLSRYIASQTIGRANAEAQRLVESAKTESQTIRQKAEVDAEKLVLSKKEAFEAEAERSRAQMRESERRLTKREDFLDKKLESLDRKEEALESRDRDLSSKLEAAEAKSAELDALVAQEIEKLSQVAQMTIEEAKSELLERVEQDTRHEMAKVVARAVQEAEDQAQERSREITVMAIQRYATEHTAEATTRAVTIPSDDMKGRIIGREGRNIRAIEKVTGVDIIVDDTPGVIVVSCFDKIRQAVAVESLNRLIADGRMHPTRIEEVVEKVKAEFEEKVIKAGKDAAMEVNLRGLHPKVIEADGQTRLQNQLQPERAASLRRSRVPQPDHRGAVGYGWTPRKACRLPARHRQSDGPRTRRRTSQDRHGVRKAVRRKGTCPQRHRRAPRGHPIDVVLHADRDGGRRGKLGPPGRSPREHGEVRPTPHATARHRARTPGRDRGIRDPGRPRGPCDGRRPKSR